MTEVAFHFNVPDKLGYACRFLRKAYKSGSKVGVLGDADTLKALDKSLWTFSALDFVPHCAISANSAVLSATAIVLGTDATRLPHDELLLHLGDSIPEGFERFARVVELVSMDEADRAGARLRWRHYADRGYALIRHDLAIKS